MIQIICRALVNTLLVLLLLPFRLRDEDFDFLSSYSWFIVYAGRNLPLESVSHYLFISIRIPSRQVSSSWLVTITLLPSHFEHLMKGSGSCLLSCLVPPTVLAQRIFTK